MLQIIVSYSSNVYVIFNQHAKISKITQKAKIQQQFIVFCVLVHHTDLDGKKRQPLAL